MTTPTGGRSSTTRRSTRCWRSATAEIAQAGCAVERVADERRALPRTTAAAIADGKVVGWFQGRMEWGPRALGNRSILGDPRRADMKDILNLKIKRRESFRPFAPSVLREARAPTGSRGRRRAVHDAGLPDPRARSARCIPAVTHVDGSGRLQTVSREHEPALPPR